MKNMNSILMEGEIIGILDNEFDLKCNDTIFPCIAKDGALPIKTGDFIRAVGRLKKDHNKIYVYAEHIEIKPYGNLKSKEF